MQNSQRKEAISLSEEEKEQVKKCKNMSKIGLPEEAVHHKMTKNKASDNVRSAVFEDESGSLSSSNGRLKRKQSGLINIYWEKLPKEKVENQQSVWQSAKKPKLGTQNVDLETLQQLFKKPVKEASKRTPHAKSNSNEMAGILQMNRAQNVAIVLTKFKQFTLDELVRIINDLNPNKDIKDECVQFLKKLIQAKEEPEKICAYNGDEKWLSQAELFFYKLKSVENLERFTNKVKVIESMELDKQRIKESIASYDILTTTCNDVRKSEKLQQVLQKVLEIGNNYE